MFPLEEEDGTTGWDLFVVSALPCLKWTGRATKKKVSFANPIPYSLSLPALLDHSLLLLLLHQHLHRMVSALLDPVIDSYCTSKFEMLGAHAKLHLICWKTQDKLCYN